MKIKRFTAVLISMAITASMIPALVFADENENVPETTETVETAESKEKETEKIVIIRSQDDERYHPYSCR